MSTLKIHLKYASYLLRHKWYVFIECVKLGIPIRGLLHDLSKFRPSEWNAYAHHFFGVDNLFNPILFNTALIHHRNRNKHHWQYWLQIKNITNEDNLIYNATLTPVEIPLDIQKEMLADWIGTSKAQSNKSHIWKWYLSNKSKMMFYQNSGVYGFWIRSRILNLLHKHIRQISAEDKKIHRKMTKIQVGNINTVQKINIATERLNVLKMRKDSSMIAITRIACE